MPRPNHYLGYFISHDPKPAFPSPLQTSSLSFRRLRSHPRFLNAPRCSSRTRRRRPLLKLRPRIQNIHNQPPIRKILLNQIHKPPMIPQTLFMRRQMRLSHIPQPPIRSRRTGINRAQRFREADDFPVFLQGFGELFSDDGFQGLDVEVVGEFVDFWMDGDGVFGVYVVVALVDEGEDFVQDVGVHFFEFDVFCLSFL